jgi:hypothetical protein
MSKATQLTQISDNVNQGYIAGRDLYLGDQYVVQETLYFEPDLHNVEPPAWTTTPKAQELAESLFKHRLIVLAGQGLDDKTMVARHLAWLVGQNLSGEVLVREWYRSSDPQKIETAFHPSATTILLLPQVQPHHVGHRLNELSRLLQARRNYLVITTAGTRTDWGIGSGSPEESLWHEISWETYYGRAFLAELLLEELTAGGRNLPEGLPRGPLETGTLLAKDLTVEETAVRLRQPDKIRRFAEWLFAQESASSRDLLAQLDQVGGDQAAIHQWYRQLDRTDQLFALALALFDGLPDNQAFAAVEFLVDEAWRRTDPNLPLFDYRDLIRLSAHFHLAETGKDGARIETSSQQKRTAILQAAWELQRRRMLAVVPAMTRLIKELAPGNAGTAAGVGEQEEASAAWKAQLAQAGPSGDKPAAGKRRRIGWRRKKKETGKEEDADSWRFTQGSQRELFSSSRRVEQLQRSVIESLSRIGLLSFEAVEGAFLELAVDGSSAVQTVVAKALAAWRGEGHHERLFQVLQNWWAAGCRTTLPKPLAQRKVKGANPLAAIRATVALAIGYALQYDPPNQLSPELLSLLRDVVADVHPDVHDRVMELTLPLAAASHPQQIDDLLLARLAEDQEQMYAIAFGLAMAYSLRPHETLRIVDRWSLMVRSQGARDPEDRTITPRDRRLAAVALIYGYIRCERTPEILTADQAVSALRDILTTETHPFVRTHTLMAMGFQGVHNFELVAPILMERISEVTLPDRRPVISVFVRAYLNQRSLLAGGDGDTEIDGRSYQVWTRTARPLTAIETSLYSWIQPESSHVARQIAVQAFTAFAATELERKERDLTIGQEPNNRSHKPIVQVVKNPPRVNRLSPLGHLTAYFAAPRPIRSLFRPVMAEVIALERSQRLGISKAERPSLKRLVPIDTILASMLVERWHKKDSDKTIEILAHRLWPALHVFRWRWVIILSIFFGAVFLRDARDWVWSHTEPLLLVDRVAIRQQSLKSLRLPARHQAEKRSQANPDREQQRRPSWETRYSEEEKLWLEAESESVARLLQHTQRIEQQKSISGLSREDYQALDRAMDAVSNGLTSDRYIRYVSYRSALAPHKWLTRAFEGLHTRLPPHHPPGWTPLNISEDVPTGDVHGE